MYTSFSTDKLSVVCNTYACRSTTLYRKDYYNILTNFAVMYFIGPLLTYLTIVLLSVLCKRVANEHASTFVYF